jgi:Rrf2 family protein
LDVFTQTTEYALRAVCCMALFHGRTVPAMMLARQTGVPLHYLAKVLQQLSAADIIRGRRGLGGGYTLRRPPAQIRLTDVVRATASARRPERAAGPESGPESDGAMGALQNALENIESLLSEQLDRYTIESILAGHRGLAGASSAS